MKTTLDYLENPGIEAFKVLPERIKLNGVGIQVAVSEQAGRGMVVMQDVGPQEVLFTTTKPMFAAVEMRQDRTSSTCDNCLVHKSDEYNVATVKREVKLSSCSGCKILRYCGKVRFRTLTCRYGIY